ncbi:uncharacterized protein [Chelonus insularis]|uniref:uncharacterized protein n=1 Tax=Chelonus insularis TaxID=460826 RepID=UPI00158B4D7C|nr:uncharacterized protein LOC118065340 [Chelonus insularis]
MRIQACNSGLNFNSQLGVCDHTVRNDCITAENQVKKFQLCPPLYIGQVPDPDDCGKYIVCYLGAHSYEDCKSGLVYNILISSCDQLQNVPECLENKTRINTTNRRNEDYYTLFTKNRDNEEDDTTIHDTKYTRFMNRILTSGQFKQTNTTIIHLDELMPVSSTTTVPIVQRSKTNLQSLWTRHWGSHF